MLELYQIEHIWWKQMEWPRGQATLHITLLEAVFVSETQDLFLVVIEGIEIVVGADNLHEKLYKRYVFLKWKYEGMRYGTSAVCIE